VSQLKYMKYILFNRNILIGFVCASLSGAVTSQIIAPKLALALNSIVTLIAEDIVFYTVFGILFYVGNKREREQNLRYEHESTTIHKTRFENVKWMIIKLISTISIAEIEYNIVKPYVQYILLTQMLEPFTASVIASLVGIAGFIAVANLMAHYTKIFPKNQYTD
jgi:hypothetical protein